MTGYWPWWLGALALSLVVLGFRVATGRGLGVSAIYRTVIQFRRERALAARANALRAALVKATRERFGDAAVSGDAPTPPSSRPLSSLGGLVFLAGLVVGGTLSHGFAGRPLDVGLGQDFARTFGHGWPSLLVLMGGGLLVGFGTQMSGGCTSGHGLNGCARLQPGSLLATCGFFGAAVVMSFLLGR